MIVRFVDGRLGESQRRIEPYTLNAADGVTKCLEVLEILKCRDVFRYEETGRHIILYTNFLLALDGKYTWDDDTQMFLLYLKDHSECKWKNIGEFTNRELRQGHNLIRLYLAGEFNNM